MPTYTCPTCGKGKELVLREGEYAICGCHKFKDNVQKQKMIRQLRVKK